MSRQTRTLLIVVLFALAAIVLLGALAGRYQRILERHERQGRFPTPGCRDAFTRAAGGPCVGGQVPVS